MPVGCGPALPGTWPEHGDRRRRPSGAVYRLVAAKSYLHLLVVVLLYVVEQMSMPLGALRAPTRSS